MEELDILLPRHTLEEALGPELAKQARLRWGEDCQFMPVSDGRRYLCTCGNVNALGEACGQCGRMSELLERAAVEQLSREAEQRLEEEAKEAARQEALRLQEARRQKRRKIRNICLLAAGAVAALALSVAGFFWVTRELTPADHYKKALAALERGQYAEAYSQFTLAGDYGDAKIYLERFYTPVLSLRSAHGNVVTLTQYAYDETGRLLREESQQMQMDADGNLMKVYEPQILTQRYDSDGNWILRTDWNGHKVCVYNDQGDVVSEEFYRNDGQHENTHTYTYVYDEQGRVLERLEVCSEHISVNYSYEYTEQYTYDDRGLITTKTIFSNYPAQMDSCYRADSQWRYNENGDPVEMVETTTETYMEKSNSVNTKTWEYDSEGRVVKTTDALEFVNDPESNRSTTVTYTYDSEGRLVRIYTTRDFAEDQRDGSDLETWEYNWEGKLVKHTLLMYYKDVQRQTYSGYQQTETYTYDLLGRKATYDMFWGQGEHSGWVTDTYTYGTGGRLETMEQVEGQMERGEKVTYQTHSISYYNENGLVEKMVYTPESDPTDKPTTNEYTYAYFYYPEGQEKPQQLNVEIISYPVLIK